MSNIGNYATMKVRYGKNDQRWMFNCKSEVIVSKSTNRILETQSNGGSRNMVISAANNNHKYANYWWRFFQYKDEQFRSIKTGKVFDFAPYQEGSRVFVTNNNGSIGQKFKIVYVDQAAKE